MAATQSCRRILLRRKQSAFCCVLAYSPYSNGNWAIKSPMSTPEKKRCCQKGEESVCVSNSPLSLLFRTRIQGKNSHQVQHHNQRKLRKVSCCVWGTSRRWKLNDLSMLARVAASCQKTIHYPQQKYRIPAVGGDSWITFQSKQKKEY